MGTDKERSSKLEGIASRVIYATLDFRLMSKLGEGTFSVVLKVKHKKSGATFAMKRFRKTFQRFVLL